MRVFPSCSQLSRWFWPINSLLMNNKYQLLWYYWFVRVFVKKLLFSVVQHQLGLAPLGATQYRPAAAGGSTGSTEPEPCHRSEGSHVADRQWLYEEEILCRAVMFPPDCMIILQRNRFISSSIMKLFIFNAQNIDTYKNSNLHINKRK